MANPPTFTLQPEVVAAEVAEVAQYIDYSRVRDKMMTFLERPDVTHM